jgi:Spy/CpxP family protein refolding chaperone
MEVNIMISKSILIPALVILLLGIAVALPAVVTAGPDTKAELEDQAPQQQPPEATAPDGEDTEKRTWQCPRCGADCPIPAGRQVRGRYGSRGAQRGARGRAAPSGHYGRDQRGAGLLSQALLRSKRLELSDEQIGRLEKLTYDAKSKMIDLNSDLDKARLEMRREFDADSDDLSAMKKQLDAVAKKRVNIQELKLQNWLDSKNVLTEEQRKVLGKKQLRMGMGL